MSKISNRTYEGLSIVIPIMAGGIIELFGRGMLSGFFYTLGVVFAIIACRNDILRDLKPPAPPESPSPPETSKQQRNEDR